MRSFRATVLTTGIAGGVLFAAHGSFPNVGSWPMIWPAIAGAAAFWLATRVPIPHRLRTGLAAALAAGVVTGAIAFVVWSIVVAIVVHTMAQPTTAATGAFSGFVRSGVLLGLAVTGVIAAVVAGVAVLPVRYVQMRHAHG